MQSTAGLHQPLTGCSDMGKKAPTILTIDDEAPIRRSFALFLEDFGCNVLQAESGEVGLEMFEAYNPDLVLVDLRMPGMDGLEVLERISAASPLTPMIVVSGAGVTRDAVTALKVGAWDYIMKPIEDLNILRHTVESCLEKARLKAENLKYQESLEYLVEIRSRKLLEYGRRLKHIAECTKEFTTCRSVEALAPVILKSLANNTDADQGSLIMAHKDREIELYLASGMEEPFVNMPPPRTQAGRIYEQATNLGGQGRTEKGSLIIPFRSIKAEVQGLAVLISSSPGGFAKKDIELSGLLTSHAMEVVKGIVASQALVKSEGRFRALTENTTDVTLIINEDGVISYASPSMRAIFGYNQDFVLNRSINEFIHPEDVDIPRKAIDLCISNPGESVVPDEVRTRHYNGEWLWVEGLFNCQYDTPGMHGIVLHCRDVTHKKKANAELKAAYRQLAVRNSDLKIAHELLKAKAMDLEESNKYKSQFMANMSHELRTPLNSIILLSGILSENRSAALSPDDVECASAINSSGKSLLYMINEVLDLAKVEAGKMDMHVEEVNLLELSRAIVKDFTPFAVEKGLELGARLEKGLPEAVYTDRHRLQQILRNFMSNAVKFTKTGSILLKISTSEKDGTAFNEMGLPSEDKDVVFSVTDTGIGIPPEKMEVIFQAFTQADGSTSREFGGTGLGLTIAKELASFIGGAIQTTSAPGRGSTFSLNIPQKFRRHEKESAQDVCKGEGEAKPDSASGITPPEIPMEIMDNLKGKTLLIVGDDMRNLYMLKNALGSAGANVLAAKNWKDAQNRLDGLSELDLAVIELELPDANGFQAAAGIREVLELESLPIIALTEKTSEEDQIKARKWGITDVFVKPVNFPGLISAISKRVNTASEPYDG